MRFRFRLLYYSIGLCMGLIFVFFILSGKNASCSYFPNARVLKNISSKPFYYSEEAAAVLKESWIDTVDVKNTLIYGDVDFDQSNVKFGNGKLYVVEGKTVANVPILLEVVNYEEKALLKSIKKIK